MGGARASRFVGVFCAAVAAAAGAAVLVFGPSATAATEAGACMRALRPVRAPRVTAAKLIQVSMSVRTN